MNRFASKGRSNTAKTRTTSRTPQLHIPIISDVIDRVRKSHKLQPTSRQQAPSTRRRLTGPKSDITAVTSVPEKHLIVATSRDGNAYIYQLNNNDEEPYGVFSNHTRSCNGIAFLADDIVATVGSDAKLFTWHATSAYPVEDLHIPEARWLTAICKLDESSLAVASQQGAIYLVNHTGGAGLTLSRRIENGHTSLITDIAVGPSCMATIALDRVTKIWDTLHYEPIAKLRLLHPAIIDNFVAVHISEHFLVASNEQGCIDLYRNARNFPLECVLRQKKECFESVTLLNDDVLMVAARSGYLGFISISKRQYICQLIIRSPGWLTKAQVLCDATIAVGDSFGTCTVVPPPHQVAQVVKDYTTQLFS